MIRITIECAIFCYDQGNLKVLLSKENNHASTRWGILTGMLENNESADNAAARLAQEYGAEKNILLRQLRTFIDPDLQGEKRNIAIGYYGLINIDQYKTTFGMSPSYKRWWKVADVPDLLLNHNKILDLSLYQIGNALRESAVGFELLPEEFTLTELTRLYKEIFDIKANEFSFCKKIVQKKIITPLLVQQTENETEMRYKFNVTKYDKLAVENFFLIF